MRKICVVTGTRAEYGLLRRVIKGIAADNELQLQLVVTGAHLSKKHGYTITEILADGFPISKQVDMDLNDDSASGIIKSMAKGLSGFADVFAELAPDLLLVLGDRYEILSAVQAAMIHKIPIAHLHGGEATLGVIDEAIRHSVTKMSHLHFVAADRYGKRVMQLGEDPKFVFSVGAPFYENFKELNCLSREELEKSLNWSFGEKNILFTYHPITLSNEDQVATIGKILTVFTELDAHVIFTLSNADPAGTQISKVINDFARKDPKKFFVIDSLGHKRYMSAIKVVDVVAGNSSSGIIEVPFFKIPTVNIGPRQDGRLRADSIIDCKAESKNILQAFKKAFDPSFIEKVSNVPYLHGDGNVSERIIRQIKDVDLSNILYKKFYDLEIM